MSNDIAVAQELLQGPKPISVEISTQDVQMLFACHTNPEQYMQLILAKLKDAGAPVEGTLRLRLAHGAVCKLKDNPMQEQAAFVYMWLPEQYVHAIAQGAAQA
jgi:hypothetical protein